jgi:hypothetical protein
LAPNLLSFLRRQPVDIQHIATKQKLSECTCKHGGKFIQYASRARGKLCAWEFWNAMRDGAIMRKKFAPREYFVRGASYWQKTQ